MFGIKWDSKNRKNKLIFIFVLGTWLCVTVPCYNCGAVKTYVWTVITSSQYPLIGNMDRLLLNFRINCITFWMSTLYSSVYFLLPERDVVLSSTKVKNILTSAVSSADKTTWMWNTEPYIWKCSPWKRDPLVRNEKRATLKSTNQNYYDFKRIAKWVFGVEWRQIETGFHGLNSGRSF